MAGLLPARRTRPEQRQEPWYGGKLAYPMVSSDGFRIGFTGVSLGRSCPYGVVAEAECAQQARHRCPGRWCDCGFYCLHRIEDARALACDPAYRHSVLLEVAASGRYIRYEKGLRYAHQTVIAVWAGRCECGWPAQVFTDRGGGVVGWRKLVPECATCAGSRPAMSLARFAALGGIAVHREDPLPSLAGSAGQRADDPDLLPLVSAEIALLQARLDELQSQLDRLARGR